MAHKDAFQVERHIVTEGSQGRRLVVEDRVKYCRLALTLKRSSACDHLIEHNAQGKEIRPRVERLAPRLFGRHKAGCARNSTVGPVANLFPTRLG